MSPWWLPPSTATSWPLMAWDQGIEWQANRIEAPIDPALEVSYVRDLVLRVVNGNVEDEHIADLIQTATDMAEEKTQRALMPQTWEMILSGFPSGPVVLERPPLIEIVSLTYLDENGDSQTLALSPPAFQVVTSGRYRKARVLPLSGTSWPTVGAYGGPVSIQYRCGYADGIVPGDILQGMKSVIEELYKNRGLSVQAMSGSVPAVLNLDYFWRTVY